uniref:Uncharacterized protein n=1 Tax=Glossina pallidipes TaxID=7398 RepID=A0A1A9ZXJ5_GLOPL
IEATVLFLTAQCDIAFTSSELNNLQTLLEQIFLCVQNEQAEGAFDLFDYKFPENGVQFYKECELTSSGNILNYVDENVCRTSLDIVLRYLSQLDIPMYLYRVKKITDKYFLNGYKLQ